MKGERIQSRQKQERIQTKEILEALNIKGSTLSRWKNNINEPDDETKLKLALILKTSVAYLMGETNDPTPKAGLNDVSDIAYIFEKDNLIEIPLYDIESVASSWSDCLYSAIPEGVKTIYVEKDSFEKLDDARSPFAITMTNDSMAGASIDKGDVLVISPADTVKSGDVAFACHGDMWLVRWIYFKPDGSIELHATNPNYTPIIVEREHAENKRWFRLVGKVVEVRHKPKNGI